MNALSPMSQFAPVAEALPPRASSRECGYGIQMLTIPGATKVARPLRGETIRHFVERVGWTKGVLPVVCGKVVDGELVPVMRKDWNRRIRKRDQITFIAMPRGQGTSGNTSRDAGSILALVALAAIAPIAAGAIFGSGTLLAGLAGAVILAGGAFLISHFLSNTPKGAQSTYSVQISTNQARSQQPIPIRYGRSKFFPDLGQPVVTDYEGINQVFYAVYVLGVGEYQVEEIGVGLTPIWTAASGTSPGFPNFAFEVIPPNVNSTLFPYDVAASSSVSGQQLPDPYGSYYDDGSGTAHYTVGPHGETAGYNFVGPFIVNPAGTFATVVAVDLIWPGGLYTSTSSTDTDSADCEVRCEYQYVTDAGAPTGTGWLVAFDQIVSRNSRTPVRITRRFTLPAPGRVQVRLARGSAQNQNQAVDTVTWGALRAQLQGPNAVPYATRMAVRILADQQLSNYSSQQIYVIATRKIPVYNGASVTLQASRNPVWAALDMWHNPDYGANLGYDKVDFLTLYQLATDADARGDAFNYAFGEQTPILDAMSTALQSILAKPIFIFDRFSAIRDQARGLPAMLLTDYEIARGSLQISYQLQDAYASDGAIVEYTDQDTWQPAEVSSSAAGLNLQNPSRIQAPGITVRRQAALFARYMYASTIYRRITATLTVEGEGKLLALGTLVATQCEMPGTWGMSVRIDAADLTNGILTLAAPFDWTAPGNRYMRIKTPTGKAWGPVACARRNADNMVLLDLGDRQAVEAASGITLAQALARTSVEEPASASISIGAPQEFLGLVTGIDVAGQGQISLTLVNDAPEVYAIDASTVTPLPVTSPNLLPRVPGALSLEAYIKQDAYTLTLYASWQPDPGALTYLAQVSYDYVNDATPAEWSVVYAEGELPIFIFGGLPPIAADRYIALRIRGRSARGVTGPWTIIQLRVPEMNFHPNYLGFQLHYYDIAPFVEDPAVRADFDALDTFVAMSSLRKQIADVSTKANATASALIQMALGNNPGLVLAYQEATSGLSVQIADLASKYAALQSTQITDKGALSSQIQALSASVSAVSTAIQTGISVAQATVNAATAVNLDYLAAAYGAAVDEEDIQAFVGAVTAQGLTNDQLRKIRGNHATLSQEVLTQASTLATSVQQITTLFAQTAANAARITQVDTAQTTATSALASRTTTVEAGLSTEVTTRAAAVSDLLSSQASLATTVQANYGALSASISTETTTRTTADQALSGRIDTVAANLTTTDNRVSAEITNRTVADASLNDSIAAVQSTVTANYAALTAQVNTESYARSTQDSAFAAQLSSVSAVANNGTANGQVVMSAQATPAGISARFSIDLYATGVTPYQSGFFLESVQGQGGRCVITASQFQIQDPSTRAVPFGISGGNVYLQGITYVTTTIRSAYNTAQGNPVMLIDFVGGSIQINDST